MSFKSLETSVAVDMAGADDLPRQVHLTQHLVIELSQKVHSAVSQLQGFDRKKKKQLYWNDCYVAVYKETWDPQDLFFVANGNLQVNMDACATAELLVRDKSL